MELDIGANLAGLLATTPWITLIALALWPEKGVIALWIKRSEAVKLAELEREKAKDEILLEAKKGSAQGQLPPPVGEEE